MMAFGRFVLTFRLFEKGHIGTTVSDGLAISSQGSTYRFFSKLPIFVVCIDDLPQTRSLFFQESARIYCILSYTSYLHVLS